MTHHYLKTGVLFGAIVLTSHLAKAQVDQTVPSMNPTSQCLINGSGHIEGIRDYSFLTSDDCKTIFVRPETIGRQHIDYTIIANLNLCTAVNEVDDRISMAEKEQTRLFQELTKISLKKATTDWSMENKRKQMAVVREQIEWIKGEISSELKEKDKNYGDIRGAKFSILSDNRIIEDDLIKIAKNNYYQVVVNGEIYEKKPIVRAAKIVESFYSFFVRKASTRPYTESVIEANAPVKLHSESDQVGILHVSAGDVLPASMVLNLPVVCVGAEKNTNGKWELNQDHQNPRFGVSRSYTVNQRVAYGYRSTLKIDGVVETFVKHFMLNSAEPFTLDDVFLDMAEHNIDGLLDFFWDQQMGADGQSLSKAQETNLKKSLLSGYLKNYLQNLIEKEVISVVGLREIGEKDGSFIKAQSRSSLCYQSSLSKSCQVEIYQLKNWNGEIDDQLRSNLYVNQVYSSNVGVNQMVPFQFTSAFQPNFKEIK